MNKKQKLWLGLWIFTLLWIALSYAYLSTDYIYFPKWSDVNNPVVDLSLQASWNQIAIDYYPWGYSVHINAENTSRILSEFWIDTPQVQYYESLWSTVNPDMVYRFLWTDVNGVDINSDVYWSELPWSWWQNAIPKILEHAKDWDYKYTWTSINVKPWTDILVKTFWGDDGEFDWYSWYSNMSKHFAFKVKYWEADVIWIAESDPWLWWWDGKVAPENMWKLNWATMHVDPNNPNLVIDYQALIDPWKNQARFLTIDWDNILVDSTSTPSLYSYIDVYLAKLDWDNIVKVDTSWADTTKPIYRISHSEYWSNSHNIPEVETWTVWQYWPSGSFLCSQWTIWTPWFVNCYNSQAPEFKWITHHTIEFPSSSEKRILLFEAHNVSASAGNAFAIAWDMDMYNEIPVDLINDPWAWTNLNWVVWTTYIELDEFWVKDTESGYDDNLKDTRTWALHTYKMEVCNNKALMVDNVIVKVNYPSKTTLVWTWLDLLSSSLLLNWSLLDDPVNDSNKINVSNINWEINLWNIPWWGSCRYLTYQVIVDNTVIEGDSLRVKNEFKYSTFDYSFTNETRNDINTPDEDITPLLTANPVWGSNVDQWDFIEYTVDYSNTWTSSFSWAVLCPRMSDTEETTCEIGQCSEFEFIDLKSWETWSFSYSVKIKNTVSDWDVLPEQCSISYWNSVKNTNIVNHNISLSSQTVSWWDFYFTFETRPKLINSPDWNPRPDYLDQDSIRYDMNYIWSQHPTMYPESSNPWTYSYWSVNCWPSSLPYKPNSYTYVANSSSTSPKSSFNLPSKDLVWQINTVIPSSKPKTILHSWSLNPTYSQTESWLNDWFKNWWTYYMPTDTTVHRAIENGTNWTITSVATTSLPVQKWQYIPYANARCSYWCGEDSTCHRSYNLYRREVVSTVNYPYSDDMIWNVTVAWSSWWLKTQWWHVHTNNNLTEDWTSSNTYNLWGGLTNVVSSPKLYSPPWSAHGDYIVSTNTNTTNLKSNKNWYAVRDLKLWHWYIYDRNDNARDFYDDILNKKMFWDVKTESENNLANPLWDFDMEMNNIYYYPWDLTIEDTDWRVEIWWNKWTIIVWWDLYINTDIFYKSVTVDKSKYLPYLGLYVKWNVYVKWWTNSVNYTIWAWHVDWTLNTWDSVYTYKHYWQIATNNINLQRKAPEYYERSVNEPSEYILFHDQIYFSQPPWFAELDEWIWSFHPWVNQYSWEIINPWD